jgi:hypothetical protein
MNRDLIEEAAFIVSGWPGVWAKLLAEHVAGADGRCVACPRNNRAAPQWPCGPAALALRARCLHGAPGPGRTSLVTE